MSQINVNDDEITRIAFQTVSASTVPSTSGPVFFRFQTWKGGSLGGNFAVIGKWSQKLKPILILKTNRYKNGIQKFYNRYKCCIVLEGNYYCIIKITIWKSMPAYELFSPPVGYYRIRFNRFRSNIIIIMLYIWRCLAVWLRYVRLTFIPYAT